MATEPPNQDEPYSWSQVASLPYDTPCQEYCPPDVDIAHAAPTTSSCPDTALGVWLSPQHPSDLFVFAKKADGEVFMNASRCVDCEFSSAQGRLTSTGIELVLSFDTKRERDLVVGTLRNHSCELAWTTNSTGVSGHWGTWFRKGAEPPPAFNAATRGYAACGDPAPFTAFNDYNSTTKALSNLEYAVGKGAPFFIAMGVFKPHCEPALLCCCFVLAANEKALL